MNSTPNGMPLMWRSHPSLRIILSNGNASDVPFSWPRNWERNPSPWQDVPFMKRCWILRARITSQKLSLANRSNRAGRRSCTGSIVDQLIYASGDIDVYVISARTEVNKPIMPNRLAATSPDSGVTCSAFGLVAISTFLGFFVRGNLEPANLVMLYLASAGDFSNFSWTRTIASCRDCRRTGF